jgi:ADP-ribosylation factor-like protein 2
LGFTNDPGDIGGQQSLRPFWRNHFEETDALIWVVDSNDKQRVEDCKAELFSILQEEVRFIFTKTMQAAPHGSSLIR